MKAVRIVGRTLVGYYRVIGEFGNCFSVILEDGEHRGVRNIGLESLEATGVQAPWEILDIGSGRVDFVDSRIPKEAYRTKNCPACGPAEKGLELPR